jgi:hypothetical protein
MEPEGSLLCSQKPATGPCTESDDSNPPPLNPISLRSILILLCHLCLHLLRGLFPSGYPAKILYKFLISPMCATCPVHLIFLDLITIILSGEHKSLSSSLCYYLQPPVTTSLSLTVGQNILLSTLFSNTLNLCFSLNIRDKVSHSYKKQVKL